MIKPESNAPSPMKPWVRTTDKQIEDLESAVARVESLIGASSGNIDYDLNQGLANTFSFTPLDDGTTQSSAGAVNFTGAITSESDISLAGALVVGDPSRQEYNPVTGEAVGSIPNLEVISGQLEINPVTEVEYYTAGEMNITDTSLSVDAYGLIHGDGLQITLANDGQVERQNIEILDASGDGTNATFEIENNTSNVAIYTAGKYVNITGVDPAGYNGNNLLITSVNTGVSPMTFTVASTESGTYVAGGYVTINQSNSTYEGKLTVQGPSPDYTGVTVDQNGVHVGTNGGDPEASNVRLDSTGLTAPSAFIDQAVINGTRLFISDTTPTAVNDGDIWIDKSGIFDSQDTYPDTWSWSSGTTAGPTASITGTSPTISVAAIPTATGSVSGIITTDAQTVAGRKTFTGGINISGAATTIQVGGNAGTAGQILTSQGGATLPTWSDNVPFKIAANRTTSTTGTSALAVNTGETFPITFPVGRFSSSPSVTVSTSSVRYVAAPNSVTTSGFTLSVRNVSDATGTTYLYHWQAIEVIS